MSACTGFSYSYEFCSSTAQMHQRKQNVICLLRLYGKYIDKNLWYVLLTFWRKVLITASRCGVSWWVFWEVIFILLTGIMVFVISRERWRPSWDILVTSGTCGSHSRREGWGILRTWWWWEGRTICKIKKCMNSKDECKTIC